MSAPRRMHRILTPILLFTALSLAACGGGDAQGTDDQGGGGQAQTAPAAPSGLSITAGNKQLALGWEAVSDATSYRIYWGTAAGVDATSPNVETVAANQLLHAGLSNLATYYYRIASVNAAGEGALSEEQSASPLFGGDELQGVPDPAAVVDNEFGYAVAVSGDTAIVGAPHANANRGTAFVFRFADGAWTQEAELPPPAAIANTHGTYGKAVAIGGDFAIVGNPTGWGKVDLSGVAVVFKRTGAAWAEEEVLIASDGAASDKFGAAVAITAEYTAVGAPEDDNAKGVDAGGVYFWETGKLSDPATKAPGAAAGDQYGAALAISGTTMIVGAPYNDVLASNAGIVYFVTLNPLASTQHAADAGAADDWFGASVAIDGDVALVGSPGNGAKAGSAVVLRSIGGLWAEEALAAPSSGSVNDQFGAAVAISAPYALVGAPLNDDAAADAGAAFVYLFDGSAWVEEARLLGSDVGAGDRFGFAVGMDGELIGIGAYLHDLAGSADAGALYFF